MTPINKTRFAFPPEVHRVKWACHKPLILVMLVAVDALSGGRLN
jgi:hypothetical protein